MHRISAAARVRYGVTEFGPMPLVAVFVLLTQSLLGAGVHYGLVDAVPHMAGAALTVVLVAWAGAQSIMRYMENPPIRRAAMLMLSCTFSQLLLGMGAYVSWLRGGWDLFPLAHAAAGIAALASAIVMAARIYRQVHPEDAELSRGGIVIA